MKTVQGFKDEYRWLSNFWPSPVLLYGKKYPSVENAYQAAKTLDKKARKPFETCKPGEAKRAGKALPLRDDWHDVKISVMRDLLQQKFHPCGSLSKKLLATGDAKLMEGNNWNDRYWGVSPVGGVGLNLLGILLMDVRQDLKRWRGKK
ncbi:MAG: NADAR family protein [Candidatus Binatia bacterium]|nr:NADAR family protein [Candidatus Binatia bacterium]